MERRPDGSAGNADYGAIGANYAKYRQPDPSIARLILAALGDAEYVLNVGAGAGAYEPTDREVTAVEPSAAMRVQRPRHLPQAVNATAENLPFPNRQFDAAMASFTVHQWADLKKGLAELRRVTRGPVIVLSCDPALVQRFWLNDYAPEVLATEARRYPNMREIGGVLGGTMEILPVPIPLRCSDGFNEAYYGRPECLLDAGARQACSAWSFVDRRLVARYIAALRSDLERKDWDRRHAHLRTQPAYDGSLRLLISRR